MYSGSCLSGLYLILWRQTDSKNKQQAGINEFESRLTGHRWVCSWNPTSCRWGSPLHLCHADRNPWSHSGSSPPPSGESPWFCTSPPVWGPPSAWTEQTVHTTLLSAWHPNGSGFFSLLPPVMTTVKVCENPVLICQRPKLGFLRCPLNHRKGENVCVIVKHRSLL